MHREVAKIISDMVFAECHGRYGLMPGRSLWRRNSLFQNALLGKLRSAPKVLPRNLKRGTGPQRHHYLTFPIQLISFDNRIT
jgi:hypothetical protein